MTNHPRSPVPPSKSGSAPRVVSRAWWHVQDDPSADEIRVEVTLNEHMLGRYVRRLRRSTSGVITVGPLTFKIAARKPVAGQERPHMDGAVE